MIGGASGIGFGLGISIGNSNNGSSKSKPKDILFNPKIATNIDLKHIKFYRTNELGVTELNRRINIGDRIDPNSLEYPGKISMVISFIGKFNDAIVPNLIVNGEVKEMFDGTGAYAGLDDGYDHAFSLIPFVANLNIDLTVDEYIRFEDIVQPYPMFLTFKVSPTSTSKEYSWGSKLKVGSFAIANRWDNQLWKLYNVGESNEILLNGEPVDDEKGYPAFLIQKKMVFTVRKNWSLDGNSPKCILAPTVLKIPAASLKYLGYIPDISGNGNHGYLHNFDLDTQLDENGVLHFDGVDDYIDFPTLRGGKQVFMKCKFNTWGGKYMLYDQRDSNNTNKFGIFISSDNPIAYYSRNSGNTYVDGVLNKYVQSIDLHNIVHNIVATNTLESPNNETTTPVIGSYYAHDNYFTNMDLYSFMLFDEISSDEDILKLNEAIGIEGNYVESPSWYYDTYNKTNSDVDKAVIANKGMATGDYDLQVKNVTFEGGSGYIEPIDISYEGPYNWTNRNDLENISNKVSLTGVFYDGGRGGPILGIELQGGYVTSYKDIPSWVIKISGIPTANSTLIAPGHTVPMEYIYFNENGVESSFKIERDGIYVLPKSYNTKFVPDPNYAGMLFMGLFVRFMELDDAGNSIDTTLILEVLSKGLLLDGVDDYITNANVPVLTDYTYIFKRDIINHDTNINALSMVKGSKSAPSKRAFISDLTNSNTSENNYYSFGTRLVDNAAKDINVVYATKTSVNGKPITPGANTDDAGIEIAKWDSYKHMAFYKLMLYPVTIDRLSINMLRNMFDFDREIDLSSPIFKPYKEYGSIPNFSQFTLRDGITAKMLPTTIEITNIKGLGPTYMEIKQPINFLFKPFTVNVEGITDDVTLYYIYGKDSSIMGIELLNGENEISYHPDGFVPVGFAVVCYEESLDCNIKITLIK